MPTWLRRVEIDIWFLIIGGGGEEGGGEKRGIEAGGGENGVGGGRGCAIAAAAVKGTVHHERAAPTAERGCAMNTRMPDERCSLGFACDV
jgi:hypothetical protein